MTEMEVLTNKTYRTYDESNQRYRFDVWTVRELLGELYTNALQDEIMQRLKSFYRNEDVIERILLQEHFPKLARQVNKEFPFHYDLELSWKKHLHFIVNAPMRKTKWEMLGEEGQAEYKKQWIEDSSICYSNMYLQMLINDPPTKQQMEDDLLGLLRYLEQTSHPVDELFEPEYVYNSSRFGLSEGAERMDKFIYEECGGMPTPDENPF